LFLLIIMKHVKPSEPPLVNSKKGIRPDILLQAYHEPPHTRFPRSFLKAHRNSHVSAHNAVLTVWKRYYRFGQMRANLIDRRAQLKKQGVGVNALADFEEQIKTIDEMRKEFERKFKQGHLKSWVAGRKQMLQQKNSAARRALKEHPGWKSEIEYFIKENNRRISALNRLITKFP